MCLRGLPSESSTYVPLDISSVISPPAELAVTSSVTLPVLLDNHSVTCPSASTDSFGDIDGWLLPPFTMLEVVSAGVVEGSGVVGVAVVVGVEVRVGVGDGVCVVEGRGVGLDVGIGVGAGDTVGVAEDVGVGVGV